MDTYTKAGNLKWTIHISNVADESNLSRNNKTYYKMIHTTTTVIEVHYVNSIPDIPPYSLDTRPSINYSHSSKPTMKTNPLKYVKYIQPPKILIIRLDDAP